MQPQKKRSDRTLVYAAIALVVLIMIPGPWLLPLQYLNTHIHELGHALTALATGGDRITIHVFADGSGVTTNYGGMPVLILQAGYILATLAGAALLLGSRTEKGARNTLAVMGGIVALALIIWVRGSTGIITGLIYAGGLLLVAAKGKGDWVRFTAGFLGLHQALASLKSFADLIYAVKNSAGENDASLLAKITPVPALVWAGLWVLISLVVVFLGLRAAMKAR